MKRQWFKPSHKGLAPGIKTLASPPLVGATKQQLNGLSPVIVSSMVSKVFSRVNSLSDMVPVAFCIKLLYMMVGPNGGKLQSRKRLGLLKSHVTLFRSFLGNSIAFSSLHHTGCYPLLMVPTT
eukprot:Blabericola_migrator_1__1354@NODE_1351_length_4742_cov_13_507166_g669_i2_p7_GENE_NODE_1351_length_4742_cov_13_507166_g669_i2NODE_1351_length_4742_cov_13_507166_g669_i2_p7_ORF_typecomplete_len123_score22_97_NODE_1351_length_4742_cov_13_507166_g669_i236303998